MPTSTYKLGRDCVASLPGMSNDDIKAVSLKASATQLDVTTFKDVPLTQWEYMAGLIDVSLDVTCTNTTAVVGDKGSAGVAGLAYFNLDAIVTEVQESVTPKGVVEYTVTYSVLPSDV